MLVRIFLRRSQRCSRFDDGRTACEGVDEGASGDRTDTPAARAASARRKADWSQLQADCGVGTWCLRGARELRRWPSNACLAERLSWQHGCRCARQDRQRTSGAASGTLLGSCAAQHWLIRVTTRDAVLRYEAWPVDVRFQCQCLVLA